MNAADTVATPRHRARRGARLGAATLTAAAAAIATAGASAAPGDLTLISRATGPAGAPVGDHAALPTISDAGTRVAFDSTADNLSADDDDSIANVFVHDTATGDTILVSRATGTNGAAANDESGDSSISGDGRYVAFASRADNLSPDDDDSVANVFVRDLLTGTTTLVSRRAGPAGAGADDDSSSPDISADGRYVVFVSEANNLSNADDNAYFNIFVRDLVTNTLTLVTRAPGPGGAGANGHSFDPTISADGGRVAFESLADNVSNEDDNAVRNVFVRELATGTNTFVSRASGIAGVPAHAESDVGEISASGRYVTFASGSNNLSAEDDNSQVNVFVRDLDEGITTLVSRADGAAGAAANGQSLASTVSDNGRVAFVSNANNLSADDDNSVTNVFVRDVRASTTELVSRAAGPAGVGANGSTSPAMAPAQSPDGRYVAFASLATNLLAGTVPGISNVYRRDVLGDAPVATPACKTLPLPPAPSTATATFTLSAGQLQINQRIGQAAVRRLNAVEGRLSAGLAARDLCGYAVGPAQLGTTITTATAGASLAPASPADPAPIVDPGRQGPGGTVTLSATQLLINQRIYQAAIRRATGIENRLDDGLTGGDVAAGAVTQGKLYDRLQVLAGVAGAEPAASVTVIPPRAGTGDPAGVTLSVTQLEINQRIAQAAVRRANALIRRLETGLSGDDLRSGTLTATDLG